VLERLRRNIREQRCVVQGFGNVGATAAEELHAIGAKVVGVSDVRGGIVNPDGLDIPALLKHKRENEYVEGFPGGEAVGRSEILETPCDVLVPAALERQVTAENAARLDCSILVEAANGPTTPEAEEILAERGILVVPDVLANAGGVTVSYFEWVQDQQKYLWDMIEVQERLRRQMRSALARVVDAADQLEVDWRTAALAVAVDRVAQAARLRAIYP
jgi:glutamate dehydrogenase (NAD(P)+)